MKKLLLLLLAVSAFLFGCASTDTTEQPVEKGKTGVIVPIAEKDGYQIINAATVGDRLLDISASLGVMPKIISARGSQWPKVKSFPTKLIGCPVKITFKAPDTLPKVIAEKGIDTVIIEKNSEFCLLVPKADCSKIKPIIKDTGVRIIEVDFEQGYDQAIRKIAALYGKEAEGESLIRKYNKEKAAAEARISEITPGKKVVVLRAFIKEDTKRLFITAEGKGFYTEKFFLDPFGCENTGYILNKDENTTTKGNFPVTNLRLLSEANPDIIVIYGSDKAAEKTIEKINALATKKADLAKVPAVKNGRFARLPFYVGSDIEDYPSILTKWIDYFSSVK